MRKTLAGGLFFSLVFGLMPVTAYAGNWYQSGQSYTFFGGAPGSRGEQVEAVVREQHDRYQVQVNGSYLKNQWLGYLDPWTGQENWLYLDENGKDVLNKWKEIGGKWYYFNTGGTICKEWLRIDGNYYYFDPVTGVMQTEGTAVRNGVTYAFRDDGLSDKVDGLKDTFDGQEGWVQEDGKWYYMRNGEKVKSEWLSDGNDKYYVDENGEKCTSGHMIDGYYYLFGGTGVLMRGGSTYADGVKYVFDQDGRGTPAEMTAEERMRHSAPAIWCVRTYEIYELSEKMWAWERRDEPKVLEGLAAQWGVTNAEECQAMIRALYEEGQAAAEKSVKAWDFSHAMMLCETGLWAGFWGEREQADMQIAMAPVIQQSFASWDEFQDAYIAGYCDWPGAIGEKREKRLRIYEWLKIPGKTNYNIDWNIPLEKTW